MRTNRTRVTTKIEIGNAVFDKDFNLLMQRHVWPVEVFK